MHPAQEYTYFFQLKLKYSFNTLILTRIFLKFVSSLYTNNLAFSPDDTGHFISAWPWNDGVNLYTSFYIDFVVMFTGHSETESLRFRCTLIEDPSQLY